MEATCPPSHTAGQWQNQEESSCSISPVVFPSRKQTVWHQDENLQQIPYSVTLSSNKLALNLSLIHLLRVHPHLQQAIKERSLTEDAILCRNDVLHISPWAGQQASNLPWHIQGANDLQIILTGVNTALSGICCSFKHSKKDKNLKPVSDLKNHSLNKPFSTEETLGVKISGKEPPCACSQSFLCFRPKLFLMNNFQLCHCISSIPPRRTLSPVSILSNRTR